MNNITNITYFKIPPYGDFKSFAEFVQNKTGINIEWIYLKVIEPNLYTLNPSHPQCFIYSNITNAWELLDTPVGKEHEIYTRLEKYNPIELSKEEIFTELI